MIKFIKKWFFPPSFSFMFYACLFGMWFVGIPERNRSWETFQNYTISMLGLFSIFYLAMDGEDGRFTNFHNWLEVQNIWIKRLIMTIILLAWFSLIALTHKYYPVIT